MEAQACFSGTYPEARRKFLDACAAASLSPKSFRSPVAGPRGEALFTDVVRAGDAAADRLFIALCGTHGIEGFCGSGCLVGYLRAGLHRELPPRTAMVLVHAINPYGFAHERRVTEGNVDLNRNFVAHDGSYPENPAYKELHPHLVPAEWEGPAKATADEVIRTFIAERGSAAYLAALQPGQYGHPDGLFYGGRTPTWPNRTWLEIIATHCVAARRVACIDFHTGLGPRGYGELIYAGSPEAPAYRRARAWYGDGVTCPAAGNSVSAVVQGTTRDALESAARAREVTALALEYGTLPVEEVLEALRADNWLHLRGNVNSALGQRIKAQMRAAFYGEDRAWKTDIWDRAIDVLRKALAGLLTAA